MSGYTKTYRSVFTHQFFGGDEFSRREAWLWMISSAAFKDHRVRIKKTMLQIKRGQLPSGRAHLAEVWGWGEQRVRTFLKELSQEGMITTSVNQGITIVTICNYEDFQASEASANQHSNQLLTSSQPEPNQMLTTHKEGKEGKEKNLTSSARENEIEGLNGNTKMYVDWLAEWLSPHAPDRDTASQIIASTVGVYGAGKVQAGMIELRTQIAGGEMPRNLAKAFPAFVKNACTDPVSKPQVSKPKFKSSHAEAEERNAAMAAAIADL